MLIKFGKDNVNAFNLNEFEYSYLFPEEFLRRKWRPMENYAIKDSEKTAKKIMKKASGWHLRIHYCSAKFKGRVQFSKRIKNYARECARPYDIIINQGTLIRGQFIYQRRKL